MCIVSVNVLEGIRFYVSFACSFSFAERKLMEGNAKLIKLIARDEALHLTGTQQMINLFSNGSEGSEATCKRLSFQFECFSLEEEQGEVPNIL